MTAHARVSLAACIALFLCACSDRPSVDSAIATPAKGDAAVATTGFVQVDGSSTVYPITEAVAEEFQLRSAGKTKVTVGVSGTGGGFKKFCRGEIDIADASRPIQQAEVDECAKAGIQFFELPVAYDALTVVVNPGNDFISELSIDELKTLWSPQAQGTVNSWKQINPAWPDRPLKLYGAGSDSGTFDYFTEAIVGKAKSSRGDYTASEDDNVLVQGVAQDIAALGYFGYAYYAENQDKLKAVPIVAGPGKPAVGPSPETVIDGSYQPLSRPLFIYVSDRSWQREEVRAFVQFYLDNAATLATEVKYIALPPAAYATAKAHLTDNKLGTVFLGRPVAGVTIEDMLERETSL